MKALLRLSLLAFLFTTPLPSPTRADTTVSACDAWMYVGQNVAVEGVVTAVTTSKKGNTFINFGGAYPHQCFKISAGPDRDTSLELLKGRKIKITGTIQLYQGKPEIKIQSMSQIIEE
jgi:DNA/RNA endonuclease YhcR with UshA esterase domain